MKVFLGLLQKERAFLNQRDAINRRLYGLLVIFVWMFSTLGCLSPPRYVIVTVDDPDALATGATTLAVGQALSEVSNKIIHGQTHFTSTGQCIAHA